MTESKTFAKTYARAASGLVRDFSQFDAALFNFLCVGQFTPAMPLMLLVWFGFMATGILEITLAYLVAFVGICFFCLTYAMLVASMPRTGGDYVYISRIINPALGFVITTGSTTIYFAAWMAWNGLLWSTVGLGTPALVLGKMMNSASLLALSSWLMGSQGILVISIASILFPALTISFGMKTFARVQYVLFAGLTAAALTLLALLLGSSPLTFHNVFNNFMGPNTYENIIAKGTQSGWQKVPFNVNDIVTFGMILMLGHLLWATFSAPVAGEIKGATKFKYSAAAMVLPAALVSACMVVIIIAYYVTLTPQFLGPLSYLYVNGDPTVTNLPIPPYYSTLPQLLASGWGIVGVIALAIIIFGYACQVFYFNATNILVPVKYLFANAFDGILPQRLAYVNRRFHTPLVAIVVMIIGGLVWSVLSWLYPVLWNYVAAVIVANALQFMVGCASGALFPFRAKDTFEASPIAKYKVAGVPLIVITGVLGVATLGYGLALYLTYPPLGMASVGALAYETVAAVFLFALAIYIVAKLYWRRAKGIDLALTFKEIPPE